MAKWFSTGIGANGTPTDSIPSPDYVNAELLVADTAEAITIPSWAKYAVFSSTGDFYANFATTATVPADTTDGTASYLNPSIIALEDTDTISLISSGTPIVCVAFYK